MTPGMLRAHSLDLSFIRRMKKKRKSWGGGRSMAGSSVEFGGHFSGSHALGSGSVGAGRRSRAPLADLDAKFVTKSGMCATSDVGDGRGSVRIAHLTAGVAARGGAENVVRFPRLDQCAHFHYEYVELPPLQITLAHEDLKPLSQSTSSSSEEDSENRSLLVQVSSLGRSWVVRRTYDNFRLLDRQLHRCCYDRKFSRLPELPPEENLPTEEDPQAAVESLLESYVSRLSDVAGSLITCGPVLNWLELDNRGHRLIVTDDSDINTPAVAAAYVVKRYTAQASDEISFEVGDMISVIDMPPPEESIWWRGKRGFQVGFFPCECVQVIGDKVPQTIHTHSLAQPSSRSQVMLSSPQNALAPTKPVLRKHGKLIAFFRSFILSRPSRRKLKQSGILKERVFGCDLGEHLLNSGHEIPMVLRCCAEFLESHGIVDGIYRLSGVTSNIQKLRNAFDEDRIPDLYTDESITQDIHSVSSVLKMYFRELPNPLLTYQLYDKFVTAVMQDEDIRLLYVRDVVQQLPPPHYRTLEYLVHHLSKVASHCARTGMTSKNIAIVWAPNLLRSKDLDMGAVAALQDVGTQAVVTEYLVRYVDLIFNDKIPSFSHAVTGSESTPRRGRPKSLAISTPTKLISIEEARMRALNVAIKPDQKYIEVGGGPQNLPTKYHTVIDLPCRKGGSLKQKRSPLGWRSLFSKGRQSNAKPQRTASVNEDYLNTSDSAILESESIPSSRKLRPVKSVESLMSGSSSQRNSKKCDSENHEKCSGDKRESRYKSIGIGDVGTVKYANATPSPRSHNRSGSHDSYFTSLERRLVQTMPEQGTVTEEGESDLDTSSQEGGQEDVKTSMSHDSTFRSASFDEPIDALCRSSLDIENIAVDSDTSPRHRSPKGSGGERRSLAEKIRHKMASPAMPRREKDQVALGDETDSGRNNSLKRASSALRDRIAHAFSPETSRRKEQSGTAVSAPSPSGSPRQKYIKVCDASVQVTLEEEDEPKSSGDLTDVAAVEVHREAEQDNESQIRCNSALIEPELLEKLTQMSFEKLTASFPINSSHESFLELRRPKTSSRLINRVAQSGPVIDHVTLEKETSPCRPSSLLVFPPPEFSGSLVTSPETPTTLTDIQYRPLSDTEPSTPSEFSGYRDAELGSGNCQQKTNISLGNLVIMNNSMTSDTMTFSSVEVTSDEDTTTDVEVTPTLSSPSLPPLTRNSPCLSPSADHYENLFKTNDIQTNEGIYENIVFHGGCHNDEVIYYENLLSPVYENVEGENGEGSPVEDTEKGGEEENPYENYSFHSERDNLGKDDNAYEVVDGEIVYQQVKILRKKVGEVNEMVRCNDGSEEVFSDNSDLGRDDKTGMVIHSEIEMANHGVIDIVREMKHSEIVGESEILENNLSEVAIVQHIESDINIQEKRTLDACNESNHVIELSLPGTNRELPICEPQINNGIELCEIMQLTEIRTDDSSLYFDSEESSGDSLSSTNTSTEEVILPSPPDEISLLNLPLNPPMQVLPDNSPDFTFDSNLITDDNVNSVSLPPKCYDRSSFILPLDPDWGVIESTSVSPPGVGSQSPFISPSQGGNRSIASVLLPSPFNKNTVRHSPIAAPVPRPRHLPHLHSTASPPNSISSESVSPDSPATPGSDSDTFDIALPSPCFSVDSSGIQCDIIETQMQTVSPSIVSSLPAESPVDQFQIYNVSNKSADSFDCDSEEITSLVSSDSPATVGLNSEDLYSPIDCPKPFEEHGELRESSHSAHPGSLGSYPICDSMGQLSPISNCDLTKQIFSDQAKLSAFDTKMTTPKQEYIPNLDNQPVLLQAGKISPDSHFVSPCTHVESKTVAFQDYQEMSEVTSLKYYEIDDSPIKLESATAKDTEGSVCADSKVASLDSSGNLTEVQKRERIEKYKEERRNFLREKYKSDSFRGGDMDDVLTRLKQKTNNPTRPEDENEDSATQVTPVSPRRRLSSSPTKHLEHLFNADNLEDSLEKLDNINDSHDENICKLECLTTCDTSDKHENYMSAKHEVFRQESGERQIWSDRDNMKYGRSFSISGGNSGRVPGTNASPPLDGNRKVSSARSHSVSFPVKSASIDLLPNAKSGIRKAKDIDEEVNVKQRVACWSQPSEAISLQTLRKSSVSLTNKSPVAPAVSKFSIPQVKKSPKGQSSHKLEDCEKILLNSPTKRPTILPVLVTCQPSSPVKELTTPTSPGFSPTTRGLTGQPRRIRDMAAIFERDSPVSAKPVLLRQSSREENKDR